MAGINPISAWQAARVRLPVRLDAVDELGELHRVEALRTPALDQAALAVEPLGGASLIRSALVEYRQGVGLGHGLVASAAVEGAMAGALLVSGVQKVLHGAKRPFQVDPTLTVVGHKPWSSSYPSGHALVSMAGATALSRFWTGRSAELIAAADTVGASRVYMGKHFPRDVREGRALGEAVGRLAAKPFEWLAGLRPD